MALRPIGRRCPRHARGGGAASPATFARLRPLSSHASDGIEAWERVIDLPDTKMLKDLLKFHLNRENP